MFLQYNNNNNNSLFSQTLIGLWLYHYDFCGRYKYIHAKWTIACWQKQFTNVILRTFNGNIWYLNIYIYRSSSFEITIIQTANSFRNGFCWVFYKKKFTLTAIVILLNCLPNLFMKLKPKMLFSEHITHDILNNLIQN